MTLRPRYLRNLKIQPIFECTIKSSVWQILLELATFLIGACSGLLFLVSDTNRSPYIAQIDIRYFVWQIPDF